MPKPTSRKERIKAKARNRRIDVQARKIKSMAGDINKLEKRIKALESKGP